MGCGQQQIGSGIIIPLDLQHPQQQCGEENPLLVLSTASLPSSEGCAGLQPSAEASPCPSPGALGHKCRTWCAGDVPSANTAIAQPSDPPHHRCNPRQQCWLTSFICGTRVPDLGSEYDVSLNNKQDKVFAFGVSSFDTSLTPQLPVRAEG